ncbi:MAG: fatty acid desaturase, partial [Pseudomonadota bacterium]
MAADGNVVSASKHAARVDGRSGESKLVRASLTAAVLFVVNIALISAALAFQNIALKLFAATVAGVVITMLAIIAHDVAHGAFSRDRRTNTLLGSICFLPGLHPYGLWKYHHNVMHHGRTAQIGLDDGYPP